MKTIHEPNLNLLKQSGLQNIRLGEKLSLRADERTHGLSGALHADIFDSSGRTHPESQGSSLSTGQRIARVLERNKRMIHRRCEISVRIEGGLLTLTYNGRYLLLQGMETAIDGWSDSSVSVTLDKISGHHFNIFGEDGGFCIAVPDDDQDAFIWVLVKHGETWPSDGPMFEAIREDEALTAELRDMEEAYTPMTRAFLVALAARHADHVPRKEMAEHYLRGTLPVHHQTALAWVRNLTGAQIDEIERFTEARLLQLHDVFDDLSELSAESEEFRSSLTLAAAEREEIDALTSLFHLAGVQMQVVAKLAETLDEKAEHYVYAVPRLNALRDNLILKRSAELDGDTWWTMLVP